MIKKRKKKEKRGANLTKESFISLKIFSASSEKERGVQGESFLFNLATLSKWKGKGGD